MDKTVEVNVIEELLRRYGFNGPVTEQKPYIHYEDEKYLKMIFRVTLEDGRMLVMKLLREDEDLQQERQKIEAQSAFSEQMRRCGIRTPRRYQAEGACCTPYTYRGKSCNVTLEDWCGEEIREIDPEIAGQIGALMARMHCLSLAQGCKIGCGTLFSAAGWNDVDSFPEFCKLCQDGRLDQRVVGEIKALRATRLERIQAVWDTLPKAAVQGDISINNLVSGPEGLSVFDYNNAGDEVLVSDLVMEGLLTAYEMDLPAGTPVSAREQLFPAFLRGYLSVRPLSGAEAAAAWEIYAMYHSLWFTRIVYSENSLDQLLKRDDIAAANALLRQMLTDMTEPDDGRFHGGR